MSVEKINIIWYNENIGVESPATHSFEFTHLDVYVENRICTGGFIMNIFDLYGNYRCQHIAEFRSLLEAVAKAVLSLTENFPEGEALEMFETNSDREWFDCSEKTRHPNYKEGFLFVGFNGASTHQYPYDDTAAKALDRFMEKYYPYIVCNRSYSLNLYKRTFEFHFEFNIDYDNEEKVSDKGFDVRNSMTLFNNDVAEVLQHKFDESDWDELIECDRDKSFYESGAVNVCIVIN